VLGDIVSTQPSYVRAPTFSYLDKGYSDYRTSASASTRPGMLYIAANDGMLHALDANSGQEQWAFIPGKVMQQMKMLADSNYQHHFFVDGQISVGDVDFKNCEATSATGSCVPEWHTILVVGLAGGGQEYFALDVTDPVVDPLDSSKGPQFLWEITDATTGFTNLGHTFGNASVNKLPNGEWTAFFSSGYNNGDGHGYLYAVDPETGAMKTGFPMSTATATPSGDGGTVASPSNLGKLAAWVTDVRADNTAEFFYGGDMNGNLWRFDLLPGTTGHSASSVFKLALLKNAAGKVQPITTKTELTKVGDTHVIFVSTGQYLAVADPTNTDVQSLYAIKDTLGRDSSGAFVTEATWLPRTDLDDLDGNAATPDSPVFLSRTLINTTDSHGNEVRSICDTVALVGSTCGTGVDVDYGIYGGWYVDFPDSGERSNVDMNLTLGTLTVPTNVPNSSACDSGGYSWINYFDYKSGLAVDAQDAVNGMPIMGQKVEGALTVGINVVQLPSGSLAAIVTTSDYRNVTVNPSFTEDVFTGHRDLWRELPLN
jgi:type IV pilus assembly protein PilY1